MAEKKPFDLSGTPWYALSEEEMAAAGWEDPGKKEETVPEEKPKGPTNPSTVVKSPWDPTRESVEETVEEENEEDLSFWLGSTRPDGEKDRRPLSCMLILGCVGLAVGVLAGIGTGQSLLCPAGGLLGGLVLGVFLDRHRQ